jgi:hypothetical protein
MESAGGTGYVVFPGSFQYKGPARLSPERRPLRRLHSPGSIVMGRGVSIVWPRYSAMRMATGRPCAYI